MVFCLVRMKIVLLRASVSSRKYKRSPFQKERALSLLIEGIPNLTLSPFRYRTKSSIKPAIPRQKKMEEKREIVTF